ncbi:MAG: hypothetical protein ACOC2W_02625 [bacterium]
MMKKYSDFKKDEMKSIDLTKFKIIVPRKEDKLELMKAFKHFHDQMFDPNLVTVNQLAHEYLNGGNIIVDEMQYLSINANIFRKKYEIEHEVCPKCGSSSYSTTLVGFAMDVNNPENYKDENDCTCNNCGDKHITHDRISIEKFNNLNRKL